MRCQWNPAAREAADLIVTMLKPEAFANALAAATALFYIFLFILKGLAPAFFKLFLNSQLFGADITSQIPKLSLLNLIGALIAVAVAAWIFGYFVAIFYNHFTRRD